MAFCLIPKYATRFKEALTKGEINPDKLIAMTSEQRRGYLGKIIGEFNAKEANILFESKLLLKNQQMGLINWAKKLANIDQKTRATIIDKINKLEEALTPKNEAAFLADLVEQRLGVKVTIEEAAKIMELTQKASSLFDPTKENWQQSREYWQARQELNAFMREIMPESIPTTTLGKIKQKSATVLSIERAIKTGFDLSAPLRQGRALFGTKEWTEAFKNMFRYAKDKTALDGLEIDMMSHRFSEQAIKNKGPLGLTLLGEKFTAREENFGSKLIDKIPLLRGSERAFVGFLNEVRFKRFTNILEQLEKADRSILDNPEAMKDLAKVIGAATGRGSLGSAEGAARSLSTVLFSPRWIASRVQTIINPLTKTGPARVEAAKSLARLTGTSVAILALAEMMGAEVEKDPRSSDFGKLKVDDARFDVTGGLAAYITLIARGLTLSSKSSTTGRIIELNTGDFGARTYLDVLNNFVENKTSPFASVIKDIAKGETFEGEKLKPEFTLDFAEYLGNQLFMPLLASEAIKGFEEGAGVGLSTTGASLFGVGVGIYK